MCDSAWYHCFEVPCKYTKVCGNSDLKTLPECNSLLKLAFLSSDLAYMELSKAGEAGLSSVNLKAPSVYQEKSEVIDHTGGKITLHDTGVVLKIPQGAFPDGEPVEITASVHWDKEYHPLNLGNGFVIGPAVRCKPAGLKFQKPIEIILPHSAENVTSKHLCIWTRTINGKVFPFSNLSYKNKEFNQYLLSK